MKRLLAGLLAALLLFVAPIAPALSISDAGRTEITRLWVSTDEADRFTCTASYIFPHISDYGSWVLTAGHCSHADLLARNGSASVRAVINWRAVITTHGEHGTQTTDLAVGTAPDVRDGKHPKLWLANKTPDQGRVYLHGFPAGIETVVTGILAPPIAGQKVSALFQTRNQDGYPTVVRKTLEEALPGLRFMVVKSGVVVGGFSGAPVLDGADRVVGVLWGVFPIEPRVDVQGLPSAFATGYDLVFFTPVEKVHDLFKTLGVQ